MNKKYYFLKQGLQEFDLLEVEVLSVSGVINNHRLAHSLSFPSGAIEALYQELHHMRQGKFTSRTRNRTYYYFEFSEQGKQEARVRYLKDRLLKNKGLLDRINSLTLNQLEQIVKILDNE